MPHPDAAPALAVDLGGTNLRAALVAPDGRVAASLREVVADPTPDRVAERIEALAGALGAPPTAPVGVGLAAQLEAGSGTVAIAPNLGWRGVPFGPMLAERLARPVRLVNDLNAVAVGEATCGAGAGARDLLAVFVGTGVGLGALVDGRLVEGADGMATELGHVKVASPLTGRHCGCGARGCLEAYTAGAHLAAVYREQTLVTPGSDAALLKAQLGTFHAGDLERAFGDGDRAAREVWYAAAEHLGRAIGNAVTLFNPRVLVLGGGVLQGAPRLLEAVAAEVRLNAGPAHAARLHIRRSALGDDAGLVGAGLVALDVLQPADPA